MAKSSTPPKSITRDQLSDRLYKLGVLQIELDLLEADLDNHINEVKRRYAADLKRLIGKVERAESALLGECEISWDVLLRGKRKSCRVLFGKAALRQYPDRIEFVPGRNKDVALLALGGLNKDFVRRTPALDKPAIKAALDAGTIGSTRLRGYGVRLVPGQSYWSVQPDRVEIQKRLRS